MNKTRVDNLLDTILYLYEVEGSMSPVEFGLISNAILHINQMHTHGADISLLLPKIEAMVYNNWCI